MADLLAEFPIDGWQVVQTGRNSLEVRIKANQNLSSVNEEYIRKVIHHHLASNLDINIRYVTQLATTPRGKLKPVFIEISPEQPIDSESHIN
jgi:hypothetical protein